MAWDFNTRGHVRPVFDAREREASRDLFDPVTGSGEVRRTPADRKPPRRDVTAIICRDPAPGRFDWSII